MGRGCWGHPFPTSSSAHWSPGETSTHGKPTNKKRSSFDWIMYDFLSLICCTNSSTYLQYILCKRYTGLTYNLPPHLRWTLHVSLKGLIFYLWTSASRSRSSGVEMLYFIWSTTCQCGFMHGLADRKVPPLGQRFWWRIGWRSAATWSCRLLSYYGSTKVCITYVCSSCMQNVLRQKTTSKHIT